MASPRQMSPVESRPEAATASWRWSSAADAAWCFRHIWTLHWSALSRKAASGPGSRHQVALVAGSAR